MDRPLMLYGEPDAKIVLLEMADARDGFDMGEESALLRSMTDMPFCHAVVTVTDWDRELSPWPAPPVFGKVPFGGEAKATLAMLEAEVLPQFRGRTLLLGGYSLAGLFALWAAYESDAFAGVAAVSPSVWYPDFYETYGARRPNAKHIYLSLGDREEKAKNRLMATVGDRIRQFAAAIDTAGTDSILEWNPGNHFADPLLRTAKGFAWLIHHSKEEA